MGHGCEGSFYVAGLKVRSGTVTASWTKDGVTRTARVFTDGAQAKAHAARTGEDVITQKGLAQLPGKTAITARIDGVDGELGFDPRASSRTARRSFDPHALREMLSPEAYRQALDLATIELPENPGESRAYSEKLAKAWFEAASPVGIAHRLAERPGVFLRDGLDAVAELVGNEGLAVAVYCEQLRHELGGTWYPLSVIADELENSTALDGVPRYHETRRLLIEVTTDRLASDPVEALNALWCLAEDDGLGYAFNTVQARLERALLAGPATPAVQDALAQLETVCHAIEDTEPGDEYEYGEPSEWVAFLTDRAYAAVGLPYPTGVQRLEPLMAKYMRLPFEQKAADGRLQARPDREPGTLPPLPRSRRLRSEHLAELHAEAEARWAMVCAELDRRYGVVSSTSMVQLDATFEVETWDWCLLWADTDGNLALDPSADGITPAVRAAHWVGVDTKGRTLVYTHRDEWSTATLSGAVPFTPARRSPGGSAPRWSPYSSTTLARGLTPPPIEQVPWRCTRLEEAPIDEGRVRIIDDPAAALRDLGPDPDEFVVGLMDPDRAVRLAEQLISQCALRNDPAPVLDPGPLAVLLASLELPGD